MSFIKQKGIFTKNGNPVPDADLIITAAIIGHAYQRLKENKNCSFDYEALSPDAEIDQNKRDDKKREALAHKECIDKINKVLSTSDLPSNAVVKLRTTPWYDVENKVIIIGGTGDKSHDDPSRYHVDKWIKKTADKLYKIALGTWKNESGVPIRVGYQGRGAYTGFIDGRENGQSALMSTYRFSIPENGGRRWIPTEIKENSGLGKKLGQDDSQRIAWGIIGDNKLQEILREEQGMYFQDQDTQRGFKKGLDKNSIVGYVHGMIQAIYDVDWHKDLEPSKKPGTPYEIALGELNIEGKDYVTTKLASCFACSIFMEATGYPASSTHLGRGESWSIIHHCKDYPDTSQALSRQKCNDKWAQYCMTIIKFGMNCLVSENHNHLNTSHTESFKEMQSYIQKQNDPYQYGNMILDALTVHQSDYKRVNNTIK